MVMRVEVVIWVVPHSVTDGVGSQDMVSVKSDYRYWDDRSVGIWDRVVAERR